MRKSPPPGNAHFPPRGFLCTNCDHFIYLTLTTARTVAELRRDRRHPRPRNITGNNQYQHRRPRMTTDFAVLTERDRLVAIENITLALTEYAHEVATIEALDAHELRHGEARNLGYYRTFIECSCGAGWWFGGHEGDPTPRDRWLIHRAQTLREAHAARVDGSAQ